MVAFFNNSAFTNEPGDPRLVAAGVHFGFTEPRLRIWPLRSRRGNAMKSMLSCSASKSSSTTQRQNFGSGRRIGKRRSCNSKSSGSRCFRRVCRVSANGTTLQASADGRVLASGKKLNAETYTIEAKAPFQQITGIRLEALPDPSLPGGGPGRDYYGNFRLQDVRVEAGPYLSKVVFARKFLRMIPVRLRMFLEPNSNRFGRWTRHVRRARRFIRMTQAQAARVQLLLIPEKPLLADGDGLLRITIVQASETSP